MERGRADSGVRKPTMVEMPPKPAVITARAAAITQKLRASAMCLLVRAKRSLVSCSCARFSEILCVVLRDEPSMNTKMDAATAKMP